MPHKSIFRRFQLDYSNSKKSHFLAFLKFIGSASIVKTIGILVENPEISNPPNFVAIKYVFDRSKLGENYTAEVF